MAAAEAPTFRFVDLFAGIGGFHHALSAPEFSGHCVLAVELDGACQGVYKSAFPDTELISDIRSITRTTAGKDRPLDQIAETVPDHEVLCAGFPCQPFSKSGFQLGLRDRTRGTLFFDILEIIRAKRPPFLILENVRNLAGPRHRETWATIVSSLREEGYRVSDDPVIFSPHLLPKEMGGTPQVRDRVFILAAHGDAAATEDLLGDPLVSYETTRDWEVDDWRFDAWLQNDEEIQDLSRYRLRDEEVGWIEAWDWFCREIEGDWLPGFPIWADAFENRLRIPPTTPKWKADFLRKNSNFYEINHRTISKWKRQRFGPLRQRVGEFPASRRRFEWQARKAQPTQASRSLWQLLLHFRPSGIRVKPPTYLPALVAITQTSVVGWRRRRITPYEAARLQGIPFTPFSNSLTDDATIYRQLGNAVSVGAVQWVARALFASAGRSWGARLLGPGQGAPAGPTLQPALIGT
jgi:DNA (cytosine-5)-methyltransferase 1